MAKWVFLKEALLHPEKYGDLSNAQIDYTPDYGTLKLIEEQTGIYSSQFFETEVNHTWYATFYEGQVYLVTGEVGNNWLRLRGKVAYENRVVAQKEILKLYENKEIGTKGTPWTEDTIDMAIKTLPKFLREINGFYWAAIKFTFYCGLDKYSGIHLVNFGILCGFFDRGNGILYDTSHGNGAAESMIRPLVWVPDDILVDIEGLGQNIPLKIKRN